jgi:hypothetical protein
MRGISPEAGLRRRKSWSPGFRSHSSLPLGPGPVPLLGPRLQARLVLRPLLRRQDLAMISMRAESVMASRRGEISAHAAFIRSERRSRMASMAARCPAVISTWSMTWPRCSSAGASRRTVSPSAPGRTRRPPAAHQEDHGDEGEPRRRIRPAPKRGSPPPLHGQHQVGPSWAPGPPPASRRPGTGRPARPPRIAATPDARPLRGGQDTAGQDGHQAAAARSTAGPSRPAAPGGTDPPGALQLRRGRLHHPPDQPLVGSWSAARPSGDRSTRSGSMVYPFRAPERFVIP